MFHGSIKIRFYALLIFCSSLVIQIKAQNSMVGDGFGGRLWYTPVNYSAGPYSGYAVCGTNKQLFGWGANQHFQLGNGSTTATTAPVAVTGMSNVAFYTASYCCAGIKTNGSLWAWGNSQATYSAIGSGLSGTPQMIIAGNAYHADAGQDLVSFVKKDGTVWSIGNNGTYAFGNGTNNTVNAIIAPVQMTGINNAVRVAAYGFGNILYSEVNGIVILLNDGTVMQTAAGHTAGIINGLQDTNSIFPVTVPGLSGKFIVDIKANEVCAYALTSAGEVYSWGISNAGALGLGTSVTQTFIPQKINFPSTAGTIIAISTKNDGSSCLALDETGNVYAWGSNTAGQLGLDPSNFPFVYDPALVFSNAKDILAGESFSYIVKNDNTLWASGATTWDLTVWPNASIWMNLSNIERDTFTLINPLISPMNLCAPANFATLPVKLQDFNVTKALTGNSISWVTSEEINISHFEVQVSSNTSDWNRLAVVQPKGISTGSRYTLLDMNNYTESAYYRLKIIDADAKYYYSPVRVIKNRSSNNEVVFSPIFSNGKINLLIGSAFISKPASVFVFSTNGELVYKEAIKSLSNIATLNKHFSQPGEYFVRIIIENTAYVKPIIL